MDIVLFEMGLDHHDVQHQMIEFGGTLEAYVFQTQEEILANPQLDLLGIKKIDDKTYCIHYFSFLMKKAIQQYAMVPIVHTNV